MRVSLTVSGTEALMTTMSASGDRAELDDLDRAAGALGDDLLEVHLVRAGHPRAAVDQRDVVRRLGQQQVEGERGTDAATPSDDGDAAVHIASSLIV